MKKIKLATIVALTLTITTPAQAAGTGGKMTPPSMSAQVIEYVKNRF